MTPWNELSSENIVSIDQFSCMLSISDFADISILLFQY